MKRSDLDQLRKLIREEIEAETESLSSDINLSSLKVRGAITDLGSKQKDVIVKLNRLEKNMKKVQEDINTIIDLFDKKDVELEKRIIQIENHLNLPA